MCAKSPTLQGHDSEKNYLQSPLPKSCPGTAMPSNLIYKKMEHPICVDFENVALGWEIKTVYYLGQYKLEDHAGKKFQIRQACLTVQER
jgi:hypothetical protein